MIELSPEIIEKMQELTDGLPTKSAKIRKLSKYGYKRADIARFLGIRYQHVRNVLLQPPSGSGNEPTGHATAPPRETGALAEDTASFGGLQPGDSLRVYRFPIDADGRIALPADALALLDACPGGVVTARFADGELRLMSVAASIRFAQDLVAPYVKEGEGNWSDQLIAERRAEAAREDAEHAP